MQDILGWTIISLLLLLGFATAVIVVLKKRKRNHILTALCIFVLLSASAARCIYLFAHKSYNKITETFKPRTGEEIYAALFGATDNSCLKVLRKQDQVIPVIDFAIYLYFETCPEELHRILQQHAYKTSRIAAENWKETGPQTDDAWFSPENFGDSIRVFYYQKDDYGNGQTIYASFDSSRAYCVDVWD